MMGGGGSDGGGDGARGGGAAAAAAAAARLSPSGKRSSEAARRRPEALNAGGAANRTTPPTSPSSAGPIAKAREALMAVCEALDPFSDKVLVKPVLLQKIGKLVGFLKSEDVLTNVAELELDYNRIFFSIRPLLCASDTLVRTACFRLIRHFLLETPAVDALVELRIHLFMIRSLEYEQRHILERMEALKLGRRIIDLECSLLPRGLVRSLVAIANQPEDNFRNVALETLRQLALRDAAAVAQCDGFRAIVNAIIDPQVAELSKSLTLTIVHLLGQSSTRRCFRPSLDLAALLSPFTDAEGAETAEGRLRWKPCQNAIILMLKTWTGLYFLASDPMGLRALVQILVQPVSLDLRKTVLDTILLVFLHLSPYDISVTKTPKDSAGEEAAGASADKERRSSGATRAANRARAPEGQAPPTVDYWGIGPNALAAKELTAFGFSSEHFPTSQTQPHVIMNQFLAMTLKAFTGCGLVDALVEIVTKENPPFACVAAQLLSFLMRISERLFPGQRHLKQFSLSELVEKATQFEELQSPDPAEKLGSRRAGRMLTLFASTTGASYDSVIATIRARYSYEDGVALSSELSLASACISEYERQSIGIFPRGEIASLPYTPHLLASILLERAMPAQGASSASLLASPVFRALSPSSRESFGAGASAGASSRRSRLRASLRSPVGLVSKSKRVEKKILEDAEQHEVVHRKMATNYEQQQREGLGDIAGRALITAIDHNPGATRPSFPLANRGHRRHVRTKMLTEHAYAGLDDMHLLLYHSQVLQGKDWTKWDWDFVDELVTGPMRHRGLCLEVMKTKFVKRIMGFFRATTIGEYLVLPWKARYQPYTSVCVTLVHLLLELPEGIDFLRYDRRGKIHRQIVEALQREIQHNDAPRTHVDGAARMFQSTYFSVGGRRDAALLEENVAPPPDGPAASRIFSPIACARSMTRDFFPILGAYTSHKAGMDLLEENGFFNVLNELARMPSKDFLLRLLLTHIDFVGSEPCRAWLQVLLLQQGKISIELNLFVVGFLRAMLRRAHTSASEELSRWVLELLMLQLGVGGSVTSAVVSVLNEVVYYPAYLAVLVQLDFAPLRPFIHLQFARPLFMRLLSTHRGFLFLEQEGWLEALVTEWHVAQSVKYATRYETLMALKLLCRNEPITAIPRSYESFSVNDTRVPPNADSTVPAVTLERALDAAFGLDAASRNASKQLLEKDLDFHPVRVPVRAFEASAEADHGFAASDLLSILRLPWTVELWLKVGDGKVVYVPVQTTLDCSHATGPEFGVGELEAMSKELRGVTCKGSTGPEVRFGSRFNEIMHRDLCVVAAPCNGTLMVPKGATLYACLTLAGDPVARNGVVEPPPDSGGGFSVPSVSRARRGSSAPPRNSSSIAHVMSRFAADSGSASTPATANGAGGGGSAHRSGGEDLLDYGLTTRQSFGDLDNNKFWIKCSPQHLNLHAQGSVSGHLARRPSQARTPPPSRSPSNASAEPAGRLFSVCPGSNSTATFNFEEKGGEVALLKVAFHLSLRPDCPNAPYIPSHLFGEMARTPNGVAYLRKKGYLREFLLDLLNTERPLLLRKSALWTVAHIGSSETGLAALLDEGAFIRDSEGQPSDVCKFMSEVAVSSDCLPLRGTAVVALGLISRTARGRALLRECGWEAQLNNHRAYGYVVVPKSITMICRPLQTDAPKRVWDGLSFHFHNPDERPPIPDLPPDQVKSVLEAVSKLINQITIKEAHGTLVRLKAKHPAVFASPLVLLRVHEYLENFSYELWVRQFLFKMFQRHVKFDKAETWAVLDGTH